MEANEHQIQQAQSTFQALCKMLDTRNWHYTKDEAKLQIECGVKGEDLPIELRILVLPRQQIVQLLSLLPLSFPSDKITDGAIATAVATYNLVDGSFDYNIKNGHVVFRLTSSFRESLLSDDLFEYMLMVSASTIDAYNDQFFSISKGMLTLQQFVEKETNNQ